MVKFAINDLKKHIKINLSEQEIVDCLDSLGLEVEQSIKISDTLDFFKVVEIQEVSKHQNANTLNLCMVYDGQSTFQIVCGANNVEKNMKAVLAPIGSIIPLNGIKIKEAIIRGEKSNGMLCSAEELCMNDIFNNNGIIKLPSNMMVGERLIDQLQINDTIIDVSVTPNRGDCNSIFGIARDLAAAGFGTLIEPKIQTNEIENNNKIIINKNTPTLAFAEINNITSLISPLWLKLLLWKSGIKTISAPVDVTNYIMVTYGQPMHIYDADKIEGKMIHSVISTEETKITALNKKEYIIPNNTLTIVDDTKKIISIAGIIGLYNSSCAIDTKNIIIESAYFTPESIAQNSIKTKIKTDASYCFERGIDKAKTKQLLLHAVKMIKEICGGITKKIQFNSIEEAKSIEIDFHKNEMEKFLGYSVPNPEKIAKNLGFIQQNLKFLPPSWRHDITTSNGLYGEISRIHGYENIPLKNSTLSTIVHKNKNINNFNAIISVSKLLASHGLNEIITWSFNSEDSNIEFSDKKILKISNPLNIEMSAMRTSMLPNLLESIAYNESYDIQNTSIFESGFIYEDITESTKEHFIITGVRSGVAIEKNIYSNARKFDIFDTKADVMLALKTLGINNMDIKCNTMKGMSIGAYIVKDSYNVGYFGKICKKITNKYKIKNDVFAFMIFIENIITKNNYQQINQYDFSKFQTSSRDFNFIIDSSIKPHELEKTIIKSIPNNVMSEVKLFDLYQNEDYKKNNKISMCFNVKIKPNNTTITTKELQAISNNITRAAKKNHNATIKDGKNE